MKCKYLAAGLILLSARFVRAEPHTTMELISPSTVAAPGDTLWVGLRLRSGDGWRTFWPNPGEGGLATKIDWTSPVDASPGAPRWPWPSRHVDAYGVITHAVPDDAVVWTPLRLADAVPMGAGWTVRARVRWLECETDCQAGETEASLFVIARTGAAAAPPLPPEEMCAPARANRVEGGWELIFAPERGGSDAAPVQFFPDALGWTARPPAVPRVRGEFRALFLGRPPGKPPRRLTGLLLGPDGWRGPGRARGARVDVPMPEED